MECLPKNLQERRYDFLVFYFARLGRKAKTWHIAAGLSSVVHALGFIVVGVVITVVMAVALFVFCIVWETVKVVKSFWAFLDGLIDMCLPDRFMRD
jgi:hypothetical protein